MLLVTKAANDIELIECAAGNCEYVAIRDEAESLGWAHDLDDEMLCEDCMAVYCEAWGIYCTPKMAA